ncbi:hypothetical protein [Streptomyces sp. NPDC088400]|uniref:hypothetical protein n=1 Tax=Streptomyces sp. NPDC088400 TaxID=3365861 RepID=UPI0038109C1F
MTSVSDSPSSIEATTVLLQGELPQLEAQQQSLEKELATVTERLESVRTALGALQSLSLAPHLGGTAVSPDAGAQAEAGVASEPAVPAAQPATAEEAGHTAEQDSPAASADVAVPQPRTEEETAPSVRGKARKAAKAAAGSERTAGASRKTVASKEAKAPTAKKAATPKPAKAPAAKKAATAVADKPADGKKTTDGKKTAAKATADAQQDGDTQAGGLTEQILEILARSGSTPVRARDVASALGRDATPGSINAVRSTLDRLVGTSRAHRAGRGLYQAPQS